MSFRVGGGKGMEGDDVTHGLFDPNIPDAICCTDDCTERAQRRIVLVKLLENAKLRHMMIVKHDFILSI